MGKQYTLLLMLNDTNDFVFGRGGGVNYEVFLGDILLTTPQSGFIIQKLRKITRFFWEALRHICVTTGA
jgi:hypothetical protein